MKITAISFGTEGDTRPLVALCRGLMTAGHQAKLLAEESGVNLATAAGVPSVALEGDIRGALVELVSSQTPGDGTSAMRDSLQGIAKTCTTAWMRSLLEEARDSDVIVFSGLTSYVALSVAEHLRIPAIGAGLQPTAATREFPSPFLPWQAPRWCNRLSHWLVMRIIWRAFRESINAARAEVTKQRPREQVWRDYPIIFGISPYLVPQPADWPGYKRMTGYWPLMTGKGWQPPQAMANFLSAGEPPVYVGFGSMVGFDCDWLLDQVLRALDGRRALLCSGWSGFDPCRLPAEVFPIEFAPHDQLFPLVSIVVHHGGAGTSHAAARAGVPSVVVPFTGDQFFWAARLTKARIAPECVPYKRLDSRLLQERMREAGAAEMRQRAASLGQLIRAEDGIGVAVAELEKLVTIAR